jgi:N-acetyl-gamma-glutamyl-phosphate reductase
MEKGLSTKNLREAFQDYYRGNPFVRVVEHLPATKFTAHSNFADLHPISFEDRIVVLASIYNLVRGASGVAVQNFNLMTGQTETAGLLTLG